MFVIDCCLHYLSKFIRSRLYIVAPKMFKILNKHPQGIFSAAQCFPLHQLKQTRNFWEYVNMMFNKPDQERITKLGPDRACAEWVLRNGGSVVWSGGKKLSDYNSLPSEEESVPKLVEIDGSNSSISHYGFSHLHGCTELKKIILHNSSYVDNRAMKGLAYGRESLTHVQVSKCADVSDAGVKEIKELKNLVELILFDLGSVNNLKECVQFLQSQLPKCDIKGSTKADQENVA